MLKKVISYFIIFTLLYADAEIAFGGNTQSKILLNPEDFPTASSPSAHVSPSVSDQQTEDPLLLEELPTPLISTMQPPAEHELNLTMQDIIISAKPDSSMDSAQNTPPMLSPPETEHKVEPDTTAVAKEPQEDSFSLPCGLNFEDIALGTPLPSDTKQKQTQNDTNEARESNPGQLKKIFSPQLLAKRLVSGQMRGTALPQKSLFFHFLKNGIQLPKGNVLTMFEHFMNSRNTPRLFLWKQGGGTIGRRIPQNRSLLSLENSSINNAEPGGTIPLLEEVSITPHEVTKDDQSSILLPSSPNEEEGDGKEGHNEAAEHNNPKSEEKSDTEKSDFEDSKGLESEREMDEFSQDEKSWKVLAAFPKFKLVPDFYRNVQQKQKDGDEENDNPSPATESTPLLAEEESPENGKSPAIPSFLIKLPEIAQSQLIRMTEQDLKKTTNCVQKIGAGWGTFVGLGVTIAIGLIYAAEVLDEFELQVKRFFPNGVEEPVLLAGFSVLGFAYFFVYFPDSLSRNAILWKKSFNYILEEGAQIKRAVFTLLASFLPSLLEPYYLISALLHSGPAKRLPELDPLSLQAIYIFCPFLFLDSMAANVDMGWEWWDDLKEWTELSSSSLASFLADRVLHTADPSPEHTIRQDFHKQLGKINKRIFTFPKDQIKDMYKTVFYSTSTIREALNIEDEYLDAARSFLVLRYLLVNGRALAEEKHKIRSRYEAVTDRINYSCLVLGSPARLLVLEFILKGFASLFVNSASIQDAVAWSFAIVGFPFQTVLEYKGMKNFFQDFLWHKKPHGHGSHPWSRKMAKTLVTFAGLLFTLPLLLLSFEVCDKWFEPPFPSRNFTGELSSLDLSYANNTHPSYDDYNYWMIAAIPFLFAEFANLTSLFNATFNRYLITSCTDIHNRLTRKKICNIEPRKDYKQDSLIRFVQREQERIKGLHPEILYQLKYGLEAEEAERKEFALNDIPKAFDITRERDEEESTEEGEVIK